FDMGSKRFAGFAKEFVSHGANMLGGCCGTTPEHIYELKNALKGALPKKPVRTSIGALSSARRYFIPGEDKPFAIVGEKINPTGKKKMQESLLHGKMELVRHAAKEQEKNGASLLDVNVGVAGIDEKKAISKAVSILSLITDLPIVIDSTDIGAIEKALRLYPGRALINSISGEKKHTNKLFSLARKYGAMVILLPIDGKAIPATFTERKKVIKRLYDEALRNGFTKDDIIIDGLVMAFSSDNRAPLETLRTIEWSHKALKCKTIIGLSNVSFGMPRREIINASFLRLAKEKGLTLAIADPLVVRERSDRLAIDLLLRKDEGGKNFIARYGKKEPVKREKLLSSVFSGKHVFRAILDGDKENINSIVKKIISKGIAPSEILKKYMVPAIIEVGKLFDKKEYFLPQLIASAETMKKGFRRLEPFLNKRELNYRKRSIVLIATVKGDIHDIGKNIVARLLRNHGFKIIDLGKDVSARRIIDEIKRHSPDVVGLSALMTTTMVNMKDVIDLSKKLSKRPIFMVGGAAVTKAYARSIGAQYARDGVDAVRIADRVGKK
ncbi:MAG: cobalamin-dependent protein, partial [Candidatus Omnitrophota bacterium]